MAVYNINTIQWHYLILDIQIGGVDFRLIQSFQLMIAHFIDMHLKPLTYLNLVRVKAKSG